MSSIDYSYDFGFVPIYDWGDLPDTSAGTGPNDYITDSLYNGPSHRIIHGLYLGNSVDNELNGQGSANANGDDLNGDDEDGFVFPSSMQIYPGGNVNIPISITNTTGDTAHFEVWIDWNGDGDFDEVGEMVADFDDGSSAFPRYVSVTVPLNVQSGENLGVRIRLSNEDNMTPYGLVNSGEVEDYLINIGCQDDNCLTIFSDGNSGGN